MPMARLADGINDQFVADALNGRPGCTAAMQRTRRHNSCVLEPAWGGPGSVFPTGVIPTQCMDPVALNLLQYLPAANLPGSVYQGVPTEADNQDQFTVRVDHKINDRQNLSIYYYYTDRNRSFPVL